MTVASNIRVVIAGGGTGGHLFPGIAIAQEFVHRNADSRILFIGTRKAFEAEAVRRAGFRHRAVTAEGLKGRGLLARIRAAVKIPVGMLQAAARLLGFRPELVIGVGGYVSGPVVLSAWLLRLRTALHEQNMRPGLTNRMLARFVDRIYISFEESMDFFTPTKCRLTGNPVRREFTAADDVPTPDSADRPFSVLIVGGSQGAHGINRAVVDALPMLAGSGRFRFVHQTGEVDAPSVSAAYAAAGIAATVQPFFHDMARQYRVADLVICRAGATTVAEVTALGKGILFIPFPHAADNHQELNARALADRGAADLILESDLNGPLLADRIRQYAADRGRLAEMARKAGRLGRPGAAAAIVDDCYELLAATPD